MNPPSVKSINPWLLPDVADAQLELVRTQLALEQKGKPPPPFLAFLKALRHVMVACPELETGTLLEVGCGVGHYGALCARHYPRLHYFGTDISSHMIAHAKALVPGGHFFATPFDENAVEGFDIVLLSQVMEFTEDPIESLRRVLRQMRSGRTAILHRLRWSKGPSRRVEEKTYLDYDTVNFIWNEPDVFELCLDFGVISRVDQWDGSATLVVEKT